MYSTKKKEGTVLWSRQEVYISWSSWIVLKETENFRLFFILLKTNCKETVNNQKLTAKIPGERA